MTARKHAEALRKGGRICRKITITRRIKDKRFHQGLKRKRKGVMKKDSWVILTGSVLVTAALFGAAPYLSAGSDRVPEQTITNLEPLNLSQRPIGDLRVSAERFAARSHEIVQCDDTEIDTLFRLISDKCHTSFFRHKNGVGA